MDAPNRHVHIYTDGSCDTGSGEGGWGFLLVFGDHRRIASGYEGGTTNNRMELTAAVEALRALKERCQVTITTDSQYLKRAFTDGWLGNWQRNGWRTASRQPVKNRDLWLELLEQTGRHEVDWAWTKGHAGHSYNERVDRLALRARKERRGVPLRAAT
jgi:ribonuclease HI